MPTSPVITLILLFAACEGTSADPAAEPAHPAIHSSTPNVTPEALGPETASSDRMFLEMMVPHHEGAVDMARIALERAEHPEIKSLAESIIASQEAEVATMSAWRKAWFGSNAAPAQGGSMEHSGMSGNAGMADMTKSIEALKTAKPFDLAFIDAMIPHHQDALRMAEDVRAKTERPEIKELADRITAAQKKEIDQMQEWRKAWFPTAEPAPGMKH
ncbi:MAG: DUF305 domain-containing protein [Myxococcota bacterium]